MDRSRLAPWSIPFFALAACHDSSGGATFLAPGVNELGIRGSVVALEDGFLVASEFENGRDVNGDGDGTDSLVVIQDLRSGLKHFVGRAPGSEVSAGAGFVSFRLNEGAEDRDLNGDGDRQDTVLHVHDARRGTTRNLGLAVRAWAQDGALIAAAVSESAQGVDLNGDGTIRGTIPHVYEADRQRLTPLSIEAYSGFHVEGRRVAYQVEEREAGDLNGDGDDDDGIVQVYDVDTGQVEDTVHASDAWVVDGSLLFIHVMELANGDADLNANGRHDDSFLQFHDLDTGRVRVTSQRDCNVVSFGEDLAVMTLEDPFQPVEIRVWDRFTDTLFPLERWDSRHLAVSFSDRRHAYVVDESLAGADLDGDGRRIDPVLHVFDARTGVGRNIGRAAFTAPRIDARRVVFLGLAVPQDMRPPTHTSVHVLELRTGVVRDLGLMASDFRLVDERIVALTPEAWQGVDLDGDQVLLDTVVQVHDLRTGRTFNTGLAVSSFDDELHPFALEGDVLVLEEFGELVAVRLR